MVSIQSQYTPDLSEDYECKDIAVSIANYVGRSKLLLFPMKTENTVTGNNFPILFFRSYKD